MRKLIAILSIGIFFTACNPPADNSANEAFEKNSATVQAYLNAWEAESVDYDKFFAENAMVMPTAVGSRDSMSRAEMIENDQRNFELLDFKVPQDIVFLPGVNASTKQMDGSVRYYGKWNITIPATDSSEAATIDMKLYQSFDFNEEGKIAIIQTYGDFGGLRAKYRELREAGSEEMEAEAMDADGMEEETE